MHPRLRFWLIVALGALAGVVVAFGVAQEAYLWAAMLAVGAGWLFLLRLGGPRPEAWVLAGVLAGYILGSRGFAQLQLTPQLPLLPAEAALGIGVVAGVYRMARRQAALVTRDALNIAILAWMAIGAARLWPDFRTYGFVAVRDFATIYYAVFFFIAQALARHEPSARLLRRVVLGALAVLPLAYLLVAQFPDFFLQTLQFRGAPLIFYKEDLVAANLLAGFFFLLTVPSWPLVWRGGLALAAYGVAFSISSSRAAIVGLIVTSGWWIAARRWLPFKFQALAAPLGVAALALVAIFQDRPFTDSRLYTLYEHVASMADFTGTGRYSTEDRRYVGDNNRFRLAWWRAVADETREVSPLFGLGFGADLSARFLRTYELDLGDEFTTRSPHSIIMTVAGRMGLVGIAAFLVLVGLMSYNTLRLARRVRIDDAALAPLGWWSIAWVILTSACFGVVLEGPMGAVLFWSALGLANASTNDLLASPQIEEQAAAPETPTFTPASAPTPIPAYSINRNS